MDHFRYSLRKEMLLVGSQRLATDDGEAWYAPMELVGEASLASLRNALLRAAENYGRDARGFDRWGMSRTIGSLTVSLAPASEFDEDYSIYEPVSIGILADGQIVLDITIGLHSTGLNEEDIQPLLDPLLARSAATFVEVVLEGSETQTYSQIRVKFNRRGTKVRNAIGIGQDVAALINSISNREFTPESALDLLAAGRADLLVGLE